MFSLVGCSSSEPNKSSSAASPSQPSKPAVKNEEPEQRETGRAAFQKVYASARIWAPDAQPLAIESLPRKGDADGKAAIWNAKFASASRRSIRTFTWSGASGEDAPERGISPGKIDEYSPENASTRPFSINFLKVDSDQAFEVAQKHGGSALLKKDKDLLTKYALQWEPRQNQLLWRIIYGPSESKLRVLVDASSGNFVKLEK
jgi:hypothetical protein